MFPILSREAVLFCEQQDASSSRKRNIRKRVLTSVASMELTVLLSSVETVLTAEPRLCPDWVSTQ